MSKHHWIMGVALGAFGVLTVVSGARADSPAAGSDSSPPAEPMACTGLLTMGGPSSCKPSGTWYDYVKKDCAARGYTAIGYINYLTACGGGFESVEYKCCN